MVTILRMRNVIITVIVSSLVLTAGCGEYLGGSSNNDIEESTPAQTATSEQPSTEISPTKQATDTKTEPPTEVVTDSDGDGLTDSREQELNTDPNDNDTDSDQLNDSEEVEVYGTNPTESDTDGDGLTDGEEVKIYSTDPLRADSDEDRLNDSTEIEEYGTSPTNNDTDSDNLTDGREALELDTSPLSADTDSDNLSDSAEVKRLETSPTNIDSDNDGIADGPEINKKNLYPGADPMKKDVFVAVDYVEKVDAQKREEIKEKFAEAPVENPDGSTGITLHIYWDDTLTCKDAVERTSGVGPIDYSCVTTGDTSDLEGWETNPDVVFGDTHTGYYSTRIVSDIEGSTQEGASIAGFASEGDTAFVEANTQNLGAVFTHELGHQLGIGDVPGHGSSVSYNQYSSVMNYNSPSGTIRFATDSGPNAKSDWEYINESISSNGRPAETVVAEDSR
ncbi:hypothetical protein [Haloarcula argentinensis]|uniref:Matrixin n=1 Tax=Haloarcula argentinensis TaxID=43776 RepID=A0A830FX72_HALAR|nr:hypothetical protein [Haloarcula argentinensis]GGM49609.1 hypothetical protein GCM10009006_33550 [Haloarcula argentinensis]